MRLRLESNRSGWEYCTFVCGRRYDLGCNRDVFVGHGNYVNLKFDGDVLLSYFSKKKICENERERTGNLHCLFVGDYINGGTIMTYLFLKVVGKINKVMHCNIYW
jgi:hypothetical protein